MIWGSLGRGGVSDGRENVQAGARELKKLGLAAFICSGDRSGIKQARQERKDKAQHTRLGGDMKIIKRNFAGFQEKKKGRGRESQDAGQSVRQAYRLQHEKLGVQPRSKGQGKKKKKVEFRHSNRNGKGEWSSRGKP